MRYFHSVSNVCHDPRSLLNQTNVQPKDLIVKLMKHEAAVHEVIGQLMKEEAAFADRLSRTRPVAEEKETAQSQARMQTMVAMLNMQLRVALETVADVSAKIDVVQDG